jgi:integrase/recombinase XerD
MARFAELLSLKYDINRTRHAYYRCMRLIHEYFKCDPATLTEQQLRDYILHVRLNKRWMPSTIRQSIASARMFFEELLKRKNWEVFTQVRARDYDSLPSVLSRQQVCALLNHIRLRRYRTPLKLIYCCGLRLGECLSVTIHDILGKENKLIIRGGKGNKDRLVPLPSVMYQELRKYWAVHKHPRLLFPNAGRGDNSAEHTLKRMRQATSPMPYCSLQRLVLVARKELNIPAASIHTLRHSFATHMLEAGAHPHTIQMILGHKNLETTMVYMHLTHQSTQDALLLMNSLCKELPR